VEGVIMVGVILSVYENRTVELVEIVLRGGGGGEGE
jgi:hypothetical protein